MRFPRYAIAAGLSGTFISFLLAFLVAGRLQDSLLFMQTPGFIAGALILGAHAGDSAFEVVMARVNATVYGMIILAFLALISRLRKTSD